ncbi:MAG: hypothetical protein A2Y25_01650 [Candidatus Melainabacteria bacterium GWF2_37_15]|nr:MAG: hypothetical protein A2Y25_01650 [Candidatus Melainabacteria bacterium GWF2_37_15]
MSDNSHILLACMPKSGSTFLVNLIDRLPDFKKYSLVPGYGDREQEIEESRINSFLVSRENPNSKVFNSKFFIAQHHVRHSIVLDDICNRHNIFRVILCRNLRDVIYSIKDHFVDEAVGGSSGVVPKEYFSWEDHKREEFIVDLIIPWYINFFMGWIKCKDNSIKMIWYEDLISNKIETVSSILKAAGHLQITTEQIDEAINIVTANQTTSQKRCSKNRFNKGISGRGQNLSQNASDKLLKLLDYYKLDDLYFKLLY